MAFLTLVWAGAAAAVLLLGADDERLAWGIGAATVVVLLLASLSCARASRRVGLAAWALLGVALLPLAVRAVVVALGEQDFPAWSDASQLVLAPVLLIAIVGVSFSRTTRTRRLRVLVEATTLAPAILFLGWSLTVTAVPKVPELERPELVWGLGCVLVSMVAVLVALLAAAERPSVHRWLLAVSFGLLVAGDLALAIGWATTVSVDPLVTQLAWLAGATLVVVAARHAATGGFAERPAAPLLRQLVVYVPVIVAFVVGLVDLLLGELSSIEAGLLIAVGILASGSHVTTFVENARLTRSLRANLSSLVSSERRFRQLLDDLAEGVVVAGDDGTIRTVSARVGDLLGWPPESLLGRSVFDFVEPHDLARVREAFGAAFGGVGKGPIALQVRRADGGRAWVEVEAGNRVADPAIGGLVISVRDLTERMRQEAALREAEERFRVAFESAPIGMALASHDGQVLKVNEAFGRMLGQLPSTLEGRALAELVLPEDSEAQVAELARLERAPTETHRTRLRYPHTNGSVVLGETSVSVIRQPDGRRYLISQVEDVTREHAIAQRLAYSARHDELTGLLNRAAFMERLASALIRRKADEVVGVVFLDLDRFKVINDSLGHAAGDRVIRAVAHRLRDTTGEGVTLARFGGDEFCAFTAGVHSVHAVDAVAERLASAAADPLPLAEGTTYITASLGVAVADRTWVTAESLVRDADAAMYQAKERGRNRTERFDPAARASLVRLHQTANELHRAIERDEFALVFQPIASLVDGSLVGFETLVRWLHPQRGPLPPADFLEVAEETGLIVPIGEVVVRKSLHYLVRWLERTEPLAGNLRLSVNISPRQLADPGFVDTLAAAIDDTGVGPGQLWLEITEHDLVADLQVAVEVLERVRSLGVGVTIDDFGTGYSSLTYLQRLPVQALKIDQSFIKGLREGSDASTIVQAVTQLAHSLGLLVTGEGVETEAQLLRLQELGCDFAQGLLIKPPQMPEAVDRALPMWERDGLLPTGLLTAAGRSAAAANPMTPITTPAPANTGSGPHEP